MTLLVALLLVDARVVSAAAASTLLVFLAIGLLLRRDLLAGFRALVARALGASPAPAT